MVIVRATIIGLIIIAASVAGESLLKLIIALHCPHHLKDRDQAPT
jgi:hypothetical protein